MASNNSDPSRLLSHSIRRIPIVGFALRCIEGHSYTALALLGANILMAVIVGVLLFGLPVLSWATLAVVAIVALLILSATID